jgi:tripartite-type tricarboxylate transporter receptor subunit TctC
MPTVIRQARDGRLRPLAVTGAKRSPAAPDIPTVAESGVPGYEVTTAYGLAAPAKTPKPILDRLHAETVKALNAPDVREKLTGVGFDVVTSTPEEFARYIRSEVAKWRELAQRMGLKA